MTKLKKRATALLLGTVTFFMALAMPYHTTEVYAVDVGFTWVVNEYSNQILQWILLYLGISVAPEAISEGKVFDKTGEFAMDFCKEFFGDTFEQWYVSNGIGDDVDSFKKAVDDVLTTDWSSVGDDVASIPSSVLDTIYNYLHASKYADKINPLSLNDLSGFKPLDVNVDYPLSVTTGTISYWNGKEYHHDQGPFSQNFRVLSGSDVRVVTLVFFDSSFRYNRQSVAVSRSPFTCRISDSSVSSSTLLTNGLYAYVLWNAGSSQMFDYFVTNFSAVCFYVSEFETSLDFVEPYLMSVVSGILTNVKLPNVDVPDIAGQDWAYDIVGWPNTFDIDKPDVKPWDGVDSLPIPGDVVLGDSIPGVIDFPDVIGKIIDGTIPWPDVIGAVRDIDIPSPDPDPDEPDKKPEPDPELPEIPAVLPQGVLDKLKDLSGKFPFCIPFDVVDCYKSFATKDNAEAPKWDIDFTIPGTNQEYHFSVDLAMFDKYIPIFRSGVLILFFIGLLLATRKLIGWQIDN